MRVIVVAAFFGCCVMALTATSPYWIAVAAGGIASSCLASWLLDRAYYGEGLPTARRGFDVLRRSLP